MGGGASADYAAKMQAASPQEVAAELAGLAPEHRAQLQAALLEGDAATEEVAEVLAGLSSEQRAQLQAALVAGAAAKEAEAVNGDAPRLPAAAAQASPNDVAEALVDQYAQLQVLQAVLADQEVSATAAVEPRHATRWDVVDVLQGHGAKVLSVAVFPDGQHLLTGSEDKTAKLWAVSTAQLLRTFEGHCSSVCSVTVFPDGQHVITGSLDDAAKVWDAFAGQLLRALEGHLAAVFPDGQQVVTGNSAGRLQVWAAGTWHLLRALETGEYRMTSLAVFPDGQRALIGGEKSVAKVWDVSTGQLLKSLDGHDVACAVSSVAVFPGGQHVVTGSLDKTAKVWNTSTWQLVQTLEGHGGAVLSVAVSADGQQVVTGSGDCSVRFWDVSTWHVLETWRGCESQVWSLDVYPNCIQAVAGAADGSVRIVANMEKCKLPLHVLAEKTSGGQLAITCMDSSGQVIGVLQEMRGHEKFHRFVERIKDELQRPPVPYQWQVVLNSKWLDHACPATLGEVFDL